MRVILGVSGGVAAYKSAELVRLLQKQGCDVTVVLTENARKFVTATTLAALSKNRVYIHTFPEEDSEAGLQVAIDHIHLARSADLFLVAPATANVIAKFANGIADDLLSTLYLAVTSPIVLAPAMNVNMWNHPAVQANLEKLRSLKLTIIPPEEGYLAEGLIGKGRLAALERIVDTVVALGCPVQDLAGETVLVTAGPTCEEIDPIRYITNRSSGKMGYEIARAAQLRGAKTILVSGPTHLQPPRNVEWIAVRNAEQMREAVSREFARASILVKAAAVSDFRPKNRATRKIKKSAQPMTLELVPTVDILAELSRIKKDQIIVGFAAETNDTLENARKKLSAKKLDLLVLNDVTQEGAGFDVDTNIVTILTKEGRQFHSDKLPKLKIAHLILDKVVELKRKRG
jgi:phosphopantothenoylcysteine decarboxylase/phosphopantothenate--cysteine ligase